jgi:hypothetical protein
VNLAALEPPTAAAFLKAFLPWLMIPLMAATASFALFLSRSNLVRVAGTIVFYASVAFLFLLSLIFLYPTHHEASALWFPDSPQFNRLFDRGLGIMIAGTGAAFVILRKKVARRSRNPHHLPSEKKSAA